MQKTVHVTFEGDFLNMKPEDISRPVYVALQRIGNVCVEKMKVLTKPHDDKGDLTNSLMWITSINRSNPENSEDMLDTPPPNCVDIGSANDHAIYRERGSAPHATPLNSAEFIVEMQEWGKKRGMTDHQIFNAINNIRDHGTDAWPFMGPVADQIEALGVRLMIAETKNFIAKMRQV
jgi:hypothetical protein